MADVRAFHATYYRPDNAILVVAGKFDEAAVLKRIAQLFGPIPRPNREGDNHLWPTYTVEPVQDGRLHVELINSPFLFKDKGSPAKYGAGMALAIEVTACKDDRIDM